jgi:hypothetical protein
MRPGPKGVLPELKVVSGTDQPCRRREMVVAALPGSAIRPKWLKGRAAKLWAEKLATYEARGQNTAGCESALAQYCALEASLIDQYRKGGTPPVAQISAFRILASEFFDTPASQIGPAKPASTAGRFAANAQRPPDA